MLSQTEDLSTAMGDIRNGDTDGLWVRTYAPQGQRRWVIRQRL